jgi:hypothetical protein
MAISRSPVVKTSKTQLSLHPPQCSQAFSAGSSSAEDDFKRRQRNMLLALGVGTVHFCGCWGETGSPEKRGIGVKHLPFLAESIHDQICALF